ncbi:MAG TPA: hypothetical protein PKW18_14030 [Candidatus Sumerlaeota bacterium]|nr:hypothetical protein [Candidatus Sumerlaeota bacterium]
MARIRTIKPEFFLHEKLAELQPLTRLLFIGLWTLADRNGRLEDRPKRIKAELLPYDDAADVNEMLLQLHNDDFITRYEVDGKQYIQIDNFSKHQHCNLKEPDGTIPAPPQHNTGAIPTRDGTCKNNDNNDSARESTCKEDENFHSARESTCQRVKARESTCGKGKGKGTGMEAAGMRAPAREGTPPKTPPPPPKNLEISAFKPSEEERLAWESLRSIPDYPADAGAFEHLRGLIGEFPELNPVKVIRSWRDYLLTAKNGKAKACPSALRAQFATADANPGLRGLRRSAGGKPAQKAAKALKPFEPDESPPSQMRLDPGMKAEFERAKERLRESVDPDSFESWIAPLEFLGMHGEELVCGVESLLQALHIKSQWDVGLVELTGHPIRYVYLQPAGA